MARPSNWPRGELWRPRACRWPVVEWPGGLPAFVERVRPVRVACRKDGSHEDVGSLRWRP
ncbi:MAG: hypothetical protein GEU99_23955 [Luteitalea sp.]|nr:hypothetical protein [Luteitalea sp.]